MKRNDEGRQLCDDCKLPKSPLKQEIVTIPGRAAKTATRWLCRTCRETS